MRAVPEEVAALFAVGARGCDVVTLRNGEITRSVVHIHRISER